MLRRKTRPVHNTVQEHETSARPEHTQQRSHQHPIAQPVKKRSEPDYEKLGKILFAIGETGTKSRKKLYRIAFFKGLWSGLGGVIGATIVVSMLLWFFNVLGNVPLLGPFIDTVEKSIPSNSVE